MRPVIFVAVACAAVAAAKNVNRPQLLPYNPVASSGAAITASDGMARFTVLTDRLIRMEYAKVKGKFEDRASLAVLHRELPLPTGTAHAEANGVLSITTSQVKLTYKVGGGFTPTTLAVAPVGSKSTFPGWRYGDANPGNLLGTIRGQDMQSHTPLNCTINKNVNDNGEFNHCEWGLVSRDGWVVYDDSLNAYTDENDWWSTTGILPPPPPPAPPSNLRNCSVPAMNGTDAKDAHNVNGEGESGKSADSVVDCCQLCLKNPQCYSYVYEPDGSKHCWLLRSDGGHTAAPAREYGTVGPAVAPPLPVGPQFSSVTHDLYGFFHGLAYRDALADYTKIGGKAIMVPRYAMGVWWSRWYDLNNYDTKKLVDDYESRDIPLDVFVIDMDWHTKDDWSGFTFDPHLFPDAADSMEYLNQKGLYVTLNLHDASGVNYWDGMFPELIKELGLPDTTKKVPMNLLNSTVAYAVEDIVLGDLINNKHVSFWWIDWQQGGTAGGMTGNKQNPTIWLAHLRCTDRHRVGDDTRAMVLARWGGMGHHRYQVGFSGDVAALTWDNLAYQPYFSATAANVLFPSWSHDIEGSWKDLEMYTRWLQAGAFSGTMRSHERGMSAGGCANKDTTTPGQWGDQNGQCAIVEPWNVSPKFFDANRRALQSRERLLPYIYTMHRQLFDVGAGIVQPLYYQHPAAESAYRMNASMHAEYYFGDDIIVAPVTRPSGDAGATINSTAQKEVWIPQGNWYDALTGKVTEVTDAVGVLYTRGYTLGEVPMWFKGGAVIPYLPLKSLKTLVGVATKQWGYLGFRIVPGGSGKQSTAVYEDDGSTTAYLDGTSHVWTTCNVTATPGSTSVAIASMGGYPAFPATRSYQIRLPNAAPPSRVTVDGVEVAYSRFGAVAASRSIPPTNQWYYAFEEDEGLGPVIDVVGVATGKPVVIDITYGDNAAAVTAALDKGLFGTLIRAVYGHANMDIDRANPDSNSPGPAYLSQLSAMGVLLEKLAGPATAKTVATAAATKTFAEVVATIPTLLGNATTELAKSKSPRVAYTLDLLATF